MKILSRKKVVKKQTKKVENKSNRRYLGKFEIESIGKKNLNGNTYNKVITVSGETYLLTDEDFRNQVSS